MSEVNTFIGKGVELKIIEDEYILLVSDSPILYGNAIINNNDHNPCEF